MPADLTTVGILSKTKIVLEPQHMVLCLPIGLQDRVVRVPYDRIESVTISQKAATLWAILFMLGLILPGVGLLLAGLGTVSVSRLPFFIGGLVLLVLGVIMIERAIIQKDTTFRVTHDGRTTVFTVIARKRRLDEFTTKLAFAIEQRQATLRKMQIQNPLPSPGTPEEPEELAELVESEEPEKPAESENPAEPEKN